MKSTQKNIGLDEIEEVMSHPRAFALSSIVKKDLKDQILQHLQAAEDVMLTKSKNPEARLVPLTAASLGSLPALRWIEFRDTDLLDEELPKEVFLDYRVAVRIETPFWKHITNASNLRRGCTQAEG